MNTKLLCLSKNTRYLLNSSRTFLCKSCNIHTLNKTEIKSNDCFTQKHLSSLFLKRNNNITAFSPFAVGRRYKGGKKQSERKEISSDSEDEEDDFSKDNESGLNRDSKVITVSTQTMRADAIYKAVLKISRSKIDGKFYEGRLRVNGEMLMKKSKHVNVGDEMDIVKGLNGQNPDFLNISRIEILKVEGDDDSISLKARYFKNLLVENYLTNPWTPELKIKEEGESAGSKKSK